jgi:hypothetical protein
MTVEIRLSWALRDTGRHFNLELQPGQASRLAGTNGVPLAFISVPRILSVPRIQWDRGEGCEHLVETAR